MSPRHVLTLALALTACKSGAPAPTPTPTTPTTAGAVAPTQGSIATARPLAAGQSLPEMVVPCEAVFYVGPFPFSADPETVRTATTIRSPSGAQVCGLLANWVTSADAVDEVAGTGCVEGDATTETEQRHTYSPGNGGSGNTPVYLKFERHDPAGCAPLRFAIVRR